MVQVLIDAKVDVQARTERRETPLHLAKIGTVAKLLVDAKADVQARGEKDYTPHAQCCEGRSL